MKKFSFPLERVLAWRRTQTRLEEAALDRLYAELHALGQREEGVGRSLNEARDSLHKQPSVTAVEISALEYYRVACAAQTAQIAELRVSLQKKIHSQTGIVADRRRDARLLERLRERRLEEWRAAAVREVEQIAAESHISRLVRALQVPDALE